MGRFDSFEIRYDNVLGVFYAGQSVTGVVGIQLAEPMKVEKILIDFKGRAKTHWTRHQGKSSTHYSLEENYFDTTLNPDYLEQFADGKLPSGRHDIPFLFQLPSDLPSSFEGPHGHIRYICQATLVRSWKWNLTCKQAFTVIACEDLNTIPETRLPVELEEISVLNCCCFPEGTVSLSFSLPKRGYVPGEEIPMSCTIVNNSKRNINRVNARLKQYVSYKGDSFWGFTDTKETSVEVNRLEKTVPIAPGTTALWHNERLHIPSLPPRLVGCSIIDVSYLLKVDVDNYISATIPVILGTVPVSDHRRLSSATTTQASHLEAPPPYCETPPPSYRQCILGSYSIEEDGDDENTCGDRFFAPKYVYYGVV